MSEETIVNLELFVDFSARKLVTRDGSQFNATPLFLGDTMRCAVRVLERAEGGDLAEVDLPVRSVKATLGKITEPPALGTFKLRGYEPAPDVIAITIAPATTMVFEATDGPTSSRPQGSTRYYSLTLDGLGAYSITEYADAEHTSTLAGVSGTVLYSAISDFLSGNIVFSNVPETAGSFNFVLTRPAEGATIPIDTAAINFNADAAAFTTAITPALPAAPAEVSSPAASCWLFRLATGAAFALTAGPDDDNRLRPASDVRVRMFQDFGGEHWCEVRLIQLPLATNEEGFEMVLPPPPSVRRIHAGAAGDDTTPPLNELQALFLPADFRGTYFLKWNFRKTRALGINDGPDEIAEALNATFAPSTAIRFLASNPEPDHAYIEFSGPLAGAPQALLSAEVNTFNPGVLTFLLPLDRAEMEAALRAVAEITVPLEIEVELGDPEAPETPGRIITLCRHDFKVTRQGAYPELAAVPKINWLRPRSPRNYIPFSVDQIIVGSQHYVATFGDGLSREFSFLHALGTSAYHITVRENTGGGRALVLGTDFEATFPSNNELVLTIPEAKPLPDLNALAVVISTAGPISAFQNHSHEIEQVNGLADLLDAINARIETLEDLVPTGRLGLPSTEEATTTTIEIPDKSEVYPGKFAADFSADEIDLDKLPRPSALLPAIHVASTANIVTVSLPSVASNVGVVLKNASIAPFLVPGGGGRRSAYAPPQGFVGCDGRFWYVVSRAGSSTSYFPTDFERELFRLQFNEKQWRAGGRIELSFNLSAQLLRANTQAQLVVVIEAGSAPQDTTPATTSENIQGITWAAAPILSQRLVLSGLNITHTFGATIKRSLTDVLSADALHYTTLTAAPGSSVPASPNIILRARLIQFDTENSVSGAVGFVRYALTEAKAAIL